ncbi:MAG: phosphate/phosphite/phosphonate ABC transporter substrate-binding protein [Acetobacteraceae bacterium]
MYDFPPLAAANDALWHAIASRLAASGFTSVPYTLDRARPLEVIWRDPDLLLAQACGYPVVTSLAGLVETVATPIYDVPGCDGPCYRSVIVIREDDPARVIADFRGRRAAINGRDSNSGMNLLRALVAPIAGAGRFFAAVRVTGSHLASIAAVASGEADVAGIDCVTYGLVSRHHPARLGGLRVLATSPPCPGLPLITAASRSAAERAAMLAALRDILEDPGLAPARAALSLVGFVPMTLADYAPVTALARAAIAAGYETLA